MQFRGEKIDSESLKIIFAGDFIPPESDTCIYSDDLMEVLADKDFSIVNLECSLTESNKYINKNGVHIKRAPKYISHIKQGQFNAVCLSNNHIRDFNDTGVLDTIKTCKNNGIQYVGAGRNINEARKPLRLNIKGSRISFLNYCEIENSIATDKKAGANPFNLISVYYDIKKEKQDSDFVFIIYHGGLEYHNIPLPGLKRSFEYMIDNGADAIICHHSHYVSGYSFYENKPIIYGLGNFYYKSYSEVHLKDLELHYGLIVRLKIHKSKFNIDVLKVKKTEDQGMLILVTDDLKIKEFNLKLNSINEIINDEFKLNNYWNDQISNLRVKYFLNIKTNNKYVKYLMKFWLKFFPSSIKGLNPSWLLNLFTCESHRETIIMSFSKDDTD